MAKLLHRIFFDSNDGSYDRGYELDLPRSIEDLARIGGELKDGLHVLIYMPNELEMEAILTYDSVQERWMASPIHGTVKRFY
jgi:hypothetical protein